VEAMLLQGRRDDAAQLAVDNQHWGLALMLGSVCSPAKYQYISKAFAEKHFASSSPLHLLSHVYSNQAQSFITHGGRTLSALQAKPGVNTAAPGDKSSASCVSSSMWRRNLAALISNKSGDWQSVVRAFGRKMEAEDNYDIFAAHFAYICSGSLPDTSSAAGCFSLVGCDVNKLLHRQLADVASVTSFRMAEIFEWLISRGLEAKAKQGGASNANAAASSSSAASGLSSLFTGLFKSSSNNELNTPPTAAPGGPSDNSTDEASKNGNIFISSQDFIILQANLCPLKLQFAHMLADFGLVAEATAYAREIRRLMNTLEIKGLLL
jgi:hypothetical protein